MNLTIILLAGLFLASQSLAQAQNTDAPTPDTEPPAPLLRADTTVVLVDVVATEKDKPLAGLTRNQFHVYEGGREQRITFFEEKRPAPPGQARLPHLLPPHIYTNILDALPGTPVNVLLLDGLNTMGPDQMEVRRQMLAYLTKLDPGTTMAVFTLTSRLRMVQGFTSDLAQLKHAVEKVNMQAQATPAGINTPEDETPSVQNPHASAQENAIIADAMKQFEAEIKAAQMDVRVRITLDALRQLAHYLDGLPGRKNLIWFSGSFPSQIASDLSGSNTSSGVRNYSNDMRETGDMLEAARVSVYPVDTRGLVAEPDMMSAPTGNMSEDTVAHIQQSQINSQAMSSPFLEQQTMQELAESTGGRAYFNTNGLKEAVADAVSQGSNYYTLLYVPQDKNFHGEFRRIKVKVDAPNTKLAYRTGYFADPQNKPSQHHEKQETLTAAASMMGAPPTTEVLFKALVLPADDPQFKNIKLESKPVGELATSLKGPVRRERVDLTIDPHGLSFKKADSGRCGITVEFAVLAYDSDGKRVNYVDKQFQIAFTPERLSYIMANGYTARIFIDVPRDDVSLRLVVHDLNAQRTGSLEVPLGAE
jgi:VWFA-related protein